MKSIFIILLFFSTFIFNSFLSDKSLTKELERLYSKEFTEDEPGGCILVKRADETIFLKCYGLEDLISRKNISENTVFNTGSISKTFVSNGILILEERGMLSLDDRIDKYFNDFENKELPERISIKHLLSHTSGLPDIRNIREMQTFFLTAKDEENFNPLKRARRLNFKPGAKFEYSNPAFNGLALIIESLTGESWQSFIEKNVFEPSTMTQSTITNGSHPESGVAHAYTKNESGLYIEADYGEVPTFAAAGNGGVWCSVLDLAKYENAIQSNTFLGRELTEQSRTVYRPETWSDTNDPFIGYSWFVGDQLLSSFSKKFDVDFVYHTGSQGGFRAFHIVIPEKDILFIGLFNRPLESFNQLIYESISLFEEHQWLEKK